MSLRKCTQCGHESDNLVEFKANPRSLYGRANLCIACHNKRTKAYTSRRRAVLDELKRKPCAICGNTFPPCAMDFHHEDEDEKSFGLADYAYQTHIALEEVLKEAAKCLVVCACCHRILHFDKED